MSSSLTPQAFVTKWRSSQLRENASYAEHFMDLCRLVGHPTPAEIDSDGTHFTFQAGVTKQSGGQGWADVWKRGTFAMEYKGKHANLDKAYQQILQYREALQNPPLLVVSDMTQIVIHTNFTNTVKQVFTLTLDDLVTQQGMQRLRALFYEPEFFRAPQTTEQVTKEAAAQFARLADQLRKWGEDAHQIAHFLIRILFCLFAEDIGLLPPHLFTQLITRTRTRPAVFARQVRLLFDAMAHGGWFGADEILHFNGRLFDDAVVLELDSDGLDILHRVSALDWSSIEPAIFGTLFERSLDPSKRSQRKISVLAPIGTAMRLSAASIRRSARSLARTTPAATIFC
ncbi:MAG TPA: type IIL restriction-modification enzyme MmeI [Roseiflexaceae bacterium]|nr:type IIL restriction-modification enzyme MmeI [Roseiflexaceae bacterium]